MDEGEGELDQENTPLRKKGFWRSVPLTKIGTLKPYLKDQTVSFLDTRLGDQFVLMISENNKFYFLPHGRALDCHSGPLINLPKHHDEFISRFEASLQRENLPLFSRVYCKTERARANRVQNQQNLFVPILIHTRVEIHNTRTPPAA
ncbi:hypothetical protein CR513_27651, partial [Mucuna pruriens]